MDVDKLIAELYDKLNIVLSNGSLKYLSYEICKHINESDVINFMNILESACVLMRDRNLFENDLFTELKQIFRCNDIKRLIVAENCAKIVLFQSQYEELLSNL